MISASIYAIIGGGFGGKVTGSSPLTSAIAVAANKYNYVPVVL